MVLELCELDEINQKYFERFEMLCWRRMEKVNWTELVIDGEMLQSSILHKIKIMKASWFGQILRKKCLLK